MSKEAMEAILANSKATLPCRGILLALAWKTYDRAPPFTGPFTVRYIATLANVEHRQAQTHIATLKKLGELVVTGKQGRAHLYGVNVALANYAVSDVDNYAVSDVVGDAHDTNYAVSDVDNYAVSDVDNYAVSDVVTTQYPAYGSYKETRNKIKQEGVTARAQAHEKAPPVENQPNGEAEADETLPPLPPLPDPVIWPGQNATTIWRATLEFLHLHPDIDHWDVSEDDLNLWAKHVIVTLPSPNRVMFRTKSELLTPAFRGATSAAVGVLSDHRMQVEYKRP